MDNLTKFYSEEVFLEQLDREIARAKRYNRTLALLILKLGENSSLAKNYSHYPVLKRCSGIMKKLIREIDIPGRVSDKLGLLMPEASPDGALTMASRVIKEVEGLHFQEEEYDFRISGAIGLSSFPEDGQTAKELLGSAEKKLKETPIKA